MKLIYLGTNTYNIENGKCAIFTTNENPLMVYVLDKDSSFICTFNVMNADEGKSLVDTINTFINSDKEKLTLNKML